MLSLFLLWPTGSSLGLVMAVVGIGIWIGVQHLGYLEFGEIARVGRRTLDQPQIFVNNLAIRRATEELKVAKDFDQVRRILTAAFTTNDFDGFELNLGPTSRLMGNPGALDDDLMSDSGENNFRWTKPGLKNLSPSSVWTIALALLSSSNRQCGTLMIYRLYSRRDLQLDVNLLSAVFPAALADALDRTLAHRAEIIALPGQDGSLIPAQAG
jgi:hypothetical protein